MKVTMVIIFCLGKTGEGRQATLLRKSELRDHQVHGSVLHAERTGDHARQTLTQKVTSHNR